LYNHFFFKGYQILSDKGVLSFITSKTFWTTQTKRNLRDLLLSQRLEYIFDTGNPFKSDILKLTQKQDIKAISSILERDFVIPILIQRF